jgi:hypothetical protein
MYLEFYCGRFGIEKEDEMMDLNENRARRRRGRVVWDQVTGDFVDDLAVSKLGREDRVVGQNVGRHEQRNIGSLATGICVQSIEDEQPQVVRVFDQRAFLY